ncbi:unnamed protein product, partial [Ceratitis capitata]
THNVLAIEHSKLPFTRICESCNCEPTNNSLVIVTSSAHTTIFVFESNPFRNTMDTPVLLQLI